MAHIVVTYPAGSGSRFDRAYYADAHMDLVKTHWAQHGLTSAEAYFPARSDAPDVAVAVLTFADAAAINAALASPETATILGDLGNFTDIAPVLERGIAP